MHSLSESVISPPHSYTTYKKYISRSFLTRWVSPVHLRRLLASATAPPTDLTQFIKSQTAYISQYYANIKWELPEAEVYRILKDTKKIIMATDGGAIAFKRSLEFVITDAKHKVLISCYGHTIGHNPLSFRTESSMFLAVLRIVLLIA